jgi:hypothetical protein
LRKGDKVKQSVLIFCVFSAIAICFITNESANAIAEQYMLGDADDGNYNGVGSIDDVYYDQDW